MHAMTHVRARSPTGPRVGSSSVTAATTAKFSVDKPTVVRVILWSVELTVSPSA